MDRSSAEAPKDPISTKAENIVNRLIANKGSGMPEKAVKTFAQTQQDSMYERYMSECMIAVDDGLGAEAGEVARTIVTNLYEQQLRTEATTPQQ